MRFSIQGGLGALAVLAAFATTGYADPPSATNSYATNPLGFFYNSLTNIDAYKHPNAMAVTGQCNRNDPQFAQARAAGAEVLAYLNADAVREGDSSVDPCDAYSALYKPDGTVPDSWLWPYLDSHGQHRVDYISQSGTNYYMLDVRAGSAWSQRIVAFVEDLMRSHTVDGVFLDVIGAKDWGPPAKWNDDTEWTEAQRDAWTYGCVDLVRKLDDSRRRINPNFLIINNNLWDRSGNDPLHKGNEGQPYVDGMVLEHVTESTYHQAYVGKTFSNLGHRRVLVIASSASEAQRWAAVQGVTNVSGQTDYGHGESPTPVNPYPLFDRTEKIGRTTTGTIPSAGLSADYKRASKFTMPTTGWLIDLEASLDGLGGASGSQQVKLVVYRDNNGTPGAKVAESSVRTLASGLSAGWRSFPVASRPLLTPGDYWLAIHTGGTAQVLRDFADGSEINWYGNADTFADGASDPFGGATSGTATLSVFGQYIEQ
jgi:hypothetical protein